MPAASTYDNASPVGGKFLGTDSSGLTKNFTFATLGAPLTPEMYGAVGDGATDDTAALQAAIDALSVGIISGSARRRVLRLNAAVYRTTSALSLSVSNCSIEGNGPEQSVIMADFTSGNALNVTAPGDLSLKGFSIRASTARQAAAADISRSGIVIDAGTSTTGYRFRLFDVYVFDQPGHGILIYNPELCSLENCVSNDNGLDGCRLYGRNVNGISNHLRRCRFRDNGQYGLYVNVVANGVHENCQALNNGAAAQMYFDCETWTHIEPDCEAFDLVTGVTTLTGMSLSGRRHKLLGGNFYALNTGVKLVNADDAVVMMPKLTGKSGTAMATGVSLDNASDRCTVILGPADSDVTATVSNLGAKNTVIDSGAVSISIMTLKPVTASPTTSYTPDLSVGSVFQLTLTGDLQINVPDNLTAGKTCEFIFIQDSTGGRNVTFNSAYHATWSNTGNSASTRSGVAFRSAGTGSLCQMGAQSDWA